MEVAYTQKALEDIRFWKNTGNKKVMTKIAALVENIKLSPFEGLGKPEPLKGNLSGYWSRRIDQEHRFVYSFYDGTLTIIQCRFHYQK